MTETPDLSVEIAQGERLDADIFALTNRLDAIDHELEVLQDEVDAAQTKAGESGEDTDYAAAERLQERLIAKIDEGTTTSQHLLTLRSPGELERRVLKALATKQSLERLTNHMSEATTETPARPKKPTAADKGAPAIYLNDDGKFRIGMDARLKSDLVNSATGVITAESPGASLQVFDPAEAERIIAAFEWGHFLDRKRQILAGDAEKKAENLKIREEKARVKAEEKAARDAAKAAEKAAKQAEAGTSTPSAGKPAVGSKAEQDRALREAKAAEAAAKAAVAAK